MWDATCPDTLAPSYITLASREAGAVAEEAEKKKRTKYAHLVESHYFGLVAVETMGVFGPEARSFLRASHCQCHTGSSLPSLLQAEDICGSTEGQYSCHSGPNCGI